MMKAGIIEEMVEETMEGLEDDDLEEAADTEVEKVLWELTKGTCRLLNLHSLGKSCCKRIGNSAQSHCEETCYLYKKKKTKELNFGDRNFLGQLGEAPDAVGDTLPAVAGATAAPDEEEEEDVGAMAARLEALRS